MKKTAKNALRQKSVDELRSDIKSIQAAHLKLRLATRTEGKALAMNYRSTRRHIARIATVISEMAIKQ